MTLAGLLCACLLLLPLRAEEHGPDGTFLPIPLHSAKNAEYGFVVPQPGGPAIRLSILDQILYDEHPSPVEVESRIAKVTAVLGAPISTATRAPDSLVWQPSATVLAFAQTQIPPAATATLEPTETRSVEASPAPATALPRMPSSTPAAVRTATGIVELTVTSTVSSTPTTTATRTPTQTVTRTPTYTLTRTSTRTASATATGTPTWTPSPTASATATPTKTPTQTFTPTSTSTSTPTRTPSPTASASATPTSTPSPTATQIPSRTPTLTDTVTPTATATETPRPTATPTPTEIPIPTATATVNPDCSGSMTLYGSADAWIDQNNPSGNFSSAAILKVRSLSSSKNMRALVFFNLPALPEGCAVETATLHLYAASAVAGRTIQVDQIGASWSEDEVTWQNQPGTIGGSAFSNSGLGLRQWDVRNIVQSMYDSGIRYGFMIRDAAENSGDAEQQYHGLKKGDNPPALTISLKPAQ